RSGFCRFVSKVRLVALLEWRRLAIVRSVLFLFTFGHPFPLMGQGRDRGVQKPIKPIIPTFVLSAGLRTSLPRRREGIAKGVEIDGEFGPNRRAGKAGHRKGRHYQGRVSSEERRGVGDEPTKL